MKKFFAVAALALAFVASAFATETNRYRFQDGPGRAVYAHWRSPVQLPI